MAVFAAPAHAAMNCNDFPSQAAAQQHLRADPSDPDGLDGPPGPNNGDGIACEGRPAPFDATPVVAQAATTTTTLATSPTTAASVPLASSGPHPYVLSLLFAGTAAVVLGVHMRGRRAEGRHWI
jgi:hypothetical protein